jgi:class 3 adenylate cyclase
MDREKLQFWEPDAKAEREIEKLRTPITILFSDIKGSTTFAEKKGDVEYMAMIDRHNRILFPVVEAEGGSVVKTIGDSILAKFDDPVAAVRAAAGMQRALAKDRVGREQIDQIQVRIGLHYGMGLVKDNDVFGDVVNAAAHIQHQAKPEQVLITDVLVDAARAAGLACAKMGRAELKGKSEPIDLYAVAWSDSATQQLIEEIQSQAENLATELKKQLHQVEEEFAAAREEWLTVRRTLNANVEELEGALDHALDSVRQQLNDNFQSEARFEIERLIRSRMELEQDLTSTRQRFEAERNNLKAQIDSMRANAIDAMERSNNPARMSIAVREQIESRVAEAKRELQLHWDRERSRLHGEIERLKKRASTEENREAARRAVLEKLGKVPSGSPVRPPKSAERWEREFHDARIQWEAEREHLNLNIKKLELDVQRGQSAMRSEVFDQLRAQYESKLADANLQRERLERDVQFVTSELASEKQRLNARIKALEEELPEAQEATRKQVAAELQNHFDSKLQHVQLQVKNLKRRNEELLEELEAERRRTRRQIAILEGQLKEAKDAAFIAQKTSDRTPASD